MKPITLLSLIIGLQTALLAQPPVFMNPSASSQEKTKNQMIKVILCNGIVTYYKK